MPSLTITLSEERHRALQESAARQGTTIDALIEESLKLLDTALPGSPEALVQRARRRSGLDEAAAMELAIEETRAMRNQ